MKKNQSALSIAIGVACVWMGTHFGPGVASGTQILVFWARYGLWGEAGRDFELDDLRYRKIIPCIIYITMFAKILINIGGNNSFTSPHFFIVFYTFIANNTASRKVFRELNFTAKILLCCWSIGSLYMMSTSMCPCILIFIPRAEDNGRPRSGARIIRW